MSDRVLTLREAARLAGISQDTLRRCSRRNELRILRLSPRRIGVRESELRRFLDGRPAKPWLAPP